MRLEPVMLNLSAYSFQLFSSPLEGLSVPTLGSRGFDRVSLSSISNTASPFFCRRVVGASLFSSNWPYLYEPKSTEQHTNIIVYQLLDIKRYSGLHN